MCYLQTQQSAKSFSFAAQRKQQLEQAEKVHAAQQQQQQSARCSPAHIKYESLSQFSQKVELYRGRCVLQPAPAQLLAEQGPAGRWRLLPLAAPHTSCVVPSLMP